MDLLTRIHVLIVISLLSDQAFSRKTNLDPFPLGTIGETLVVCNCVMCVQQVCMCVCVVITHILCVTLACLFVLSLCLCVCIYASVHVCSVCLLVLPYVHLKK